MVLVSQIDEGERESIKESFLVFRRVLYVSGVSGHERREVRYQTSSPHRYMHVGVLGIRFGLRFGELKFWGLWLVRVCLKLVVV